MKTIFKLYNESLVITEKESALIQRALNNGIISNVRLLENFHKFRDKELKNYRNINYNFVLEFNKHYENNKTHSENFINLIKFLSRTKIPKESFVKV